MFDDKDAEISRLMGEAHQLKDSVDSQRLVLEESQVQNSSLRQRCQDVEMSLAAQSAAQPVDQVRSAAPPPAISAQLQSMMEVLQDLSTRMPALEDAQAVHVDQFQSHNSAAVSFRFPPSGLPPRPHPPSPALAGSGGPGFPSDDGGDGR